jgi:hypothetical protein
MRAVVRITTASESRVYELSEGQKALLGRSVACDIVVNDASVSRRHCSILLEENALLVTDLESSHGIRHGNRVVAECRILKGEEVVVGLAKITLESIVVDEIVASAEVRSDQSTTGKTSHNELIGETLGGYRIASILGAGGQAVVYAAEQVRLGREVALKVLRNPDTGSTAESVASFLREATDSAVENPWPRSCAKPELLLRYPIRDSFRSTISGSTETDTSCRWSSCGAAAWQRVSARRAR